MAIATAADGTASYFEAFGEGAPVILIGGGFNDRSTVKGLARRWPRGARRSSATGADLVPG